MARWSGGQVGDHDRVQDQVQEQETFCSGKAIFGVFGFQKKKEEKKMYILLTGFCKSFLGILCTKLEIFGSFYVC